MSTQHSHKWTTAIAAAAAAASSEGVKQWPINPTLDTLYRQSRLNSPQKLLKKTRSKAATVEPALRAKQTAAFYRRWCSGLSVPELCLVTLPIGCRRLWRLPVQKSVFQLKWWNLQARTQNGWRNQCAKYRRVWRGRTPPINPRDALKALSQNLKGSDIFS